ncbi:MAG: zf-HC2 domain-containing protein [Gaiellaceae bacterium]
MHGDCERARQWASADVDGELSRFEQVLLEGHLGDCVSCSEFHASIGGLTRTLRAVPLELVPAIEIGRIRRRLSLRLAPAAAAMAVAVVGFGSIMASSALRPGSVGSLQSAGPSSDVSFPDTMNLRTSKALVFRAAKERLAIRLRGSLGGGPVLQDR